jgi:hypothetical protein
MKFIREKHIRVKTPITVDGLTLAYDAFSRPKYSVTHLPLTAKIYLEKANKKLPPHLKKVIEIIDPIETPEPLPKPTALSKLRKLAEQNDVEDNDEDYDTLGPTTQGKSKT